MIPDLKNRRLLGTTRISSWWLKLPLSLSKLRVGDDWDHVTPCKFSAFALSKSRGHACAGTYLRMEMLCTMIRTLGECLMKLWKLNKIKQANLPQCLAHTTFQMVTFHLNCMNLPVSDYLWCTKKRQLPMDKPTHNSIQSSTN